MTNVETKIKNFLLETIKDCQENQEEIDSGHRPECEDGSDFALEHLQDYCEVLLSRIEEWQQ